MLSVELVLGIYTSNAFYEYLGSTRLMVGCQTDHPWHSCNQYTSYYPVYTSSKIFFTFSIINISHLPLRFCICIVSWVGVWLHLWFGQSRARAFLHPLSSLGATTKDGQSVGRGVPHNTKVRVNGRAIETVSGPRPNNWPRPTDAYLIII
ncbi:hypothetical protein F4677DRAFT_40600 [Hypoxylon crocopeplum]|nr:hypothetical protein F4677DRAFT_40600 [Hypoxylon crocopeplum]